MTWNVNISRGRETGLHPRFVEAAGSIFMLRHNLPVGCMLADGLS